jgi:hypothetical protein
MSSMSKLLKVAIVLFVALISTLAPAVNAQEGEPLTEPALVLSSGMLDVDNTVLYTMTLVAGPEAISDATLSAVLPADATFVDVFWTPELATFEGESDGTVTWIIPEIEPQTTLGAFTVRVSFEGSKETDFEAPGGINAMLTWADGSIEAISFPFTVAAFEETGSIEITPEGTGEELVQVGETGIWLSVPADAVSENVTLTFSHLPVPEDTSDLPAIAEDTWWCGLFNVTADKDVTFAQPITLVLPNRKAITPYSPIPVFWKEEGGEWVLAGDGIAEGAAAVASTNLFGNLTYISINEATFGTVARQIAIGIRSELRVAGQSSTVGSPIALPIYSSGSWHELTLIVNP